MNPEDQKPVQPPKSTGGVNEPLQTPTAPQLPANQFKPNMADPAAEPVNNQPNLQPQPQPNVPPPTVNPQPGNMSAANLPNPPRQPVKKPKSKKLLFIIVAVVLVLIIAGGATVYVLRSKPTPTTTSSGLDTNNPQSTYTDTTTTPPPATTDPGSSSKIVSTTATGGTVNNGNPTGIPSATTFDEAVLKSIAEAEKSNSPAKLVNKTYITGTEQTISEDWKVSVNGKDVTYTVVTTIDNNNNTTYTINKKT